MEEAIETQLGVLNKILNNLKKCPKDREYLEETLLNKLAVSKECKEKIYALLFQKNCKLTSTQHQYFSTSAKILYDEIHTIIDEQLKKIKVESSKTIFTIACSILFVTKLKLKLHQKMAAEIIKITSSLIPQYDGNGEKLGNVIAALTALKAVVTAQTMPLAVQIVLSKLEKKARSAVGDAPADIDAIIDSLNRKCKQHISADVVLAKLNATRQSGALNKFSSEIEELTNKLELAYLNDQIPADIAAKMANKAGIKALAAGMKNTNTQLILKAGTFNTLNDAIGRAAENDNETTTTASVLNCNRQRYNGYRNNQRGYQRGRGGRYNQSYRQNNYQNNNHRNNNSNYNNNSNWRNSNGRNASNNNNQYQGNDRRQDRSNNDSRNNSNRGRVYQVSSENERNGQQDNRNQNNFLERADRSERSSQ